MTALAPGRYPFLKPGSFRPGQTVHATIAGPVFGFAGQFGARLCVTVYFGAIDRIYRELVVNFRSPSYVRLCEQLGDDLTGWKGKQIGLKVVRHARDRRPRVEVV